MISFDRRSALARLFFFSERARLAFRNKSRWYQEPQRADTCQYIRTVFVIMPLAIVSNLVAVGLAVFAVIVHPVILFGSSYGLLWVYIGAGLSAGAAAVAVIYFVAHMTRNSQALPGLVGDVGVFLGAHYRGWKDKYCPTISFNGETDA